MAERPLIIAMVGSFPPPLTGTTILLDQLYQELGACPDVDLRQVNTLGVRGAGVRFVWRLARLVVHLARSVRGADILALHINTSGLHALGPLAWAVARVFGKPLLIRKFGGTDFQHFGKLQAAISRFVVRHAAMYLAETQVLVASARADGIEHAHWYANSRPMPALEQDEPEAEAPRKKFIYLGQVRQTKGLPEIMAAAKMLEGRAEIDVYGPLFPDVEEDALTGAQHLNYRGLLGRDDIIPTLARYDALLLPSYYHGEGYPGVILEAFGAGIPIICTRWRALPEIVDDTCGILIEPKNSTALLEAMTRLLDDAELRKTLQAGSRLKREQFDSQVWTERFVSLCRACCEAWPGRWTPGDVKKKENAST